MKKIYDKMGDILENKQLEMAFRKNIYYGVVFISLLGSLFHFLYDLSGKAIFVGLIAPVNESVFEHLKLAFFPTLLWWALLYFPFYKKYGIERERWLIAAVASATISPLFILCFYYTYTGAFGFQSPFLDVSSLLLGALLGQLVARKVYLRGKPKRIHFYLAVLAFIIMFAGFIVFTFHPPKLPLFQDN
ncbi:MAG: DUF6512 family protein [Bacilli bacterium]